MKEKKGEEFEKLVTKFYKLLITNPEYESVEHDVLVETPDGSRQIDVLIKSRSFGIEIKTIIECKDHSRKISVGVIDAFQSKMAEVKANKGIIITRNGFSSTAIAKAKRFDITLSTMHEALRTDWDPDIDMPVLIEEIHPTNKVNFNILDEGLDESIELPTSEAAVINGYNLGELLFEDLHSKKIDYINKNMNSVKVSFDKIKPPYILKGVNEDLSIRDFEFFMTVENVYYISKLSKIGEIMLIKDLTENNSQMLMNIDSLKEYKTRSEKLEKALKYKITGMVISFVVEDSVRYLGSSMGIFKVFT